MQNWIYKRLKIVAMATSIAISTFTCLSFGQVRPSLLVDGEIVPFDPKYSSAASASTRYGILSNLQSLIDHLIEEGIETIGGVDLRRFKNQLQEINFYVVEGKAVAVGTGYVSLRAGSVYITETKSVYLNAEFLKEPRTMWPVVLHESFGALGYNDESGQITTVLLSDDRKAIVKTINSKKMDFSRLLKKTPRLKSIVNLNGSKEASGGTTVIGGGGDEILISAKMYMLNHFSEWKAHGLGRYTSSKGFEFTKSQANFDIQSKITDDVLNDFLLYFIQSPIELWTTRSGPIPGRLKNRKDINQIVGSFTDTPLDAGPQAPPFLRLSRDHWNMSIEGHTIEESRDMISNTALLDLFFHYLIYRYEK